MKSTLLLAALATTGTVARSHGHIHQRLSHSHGHEKRDVKEEIVTVTVCKLGVMELPGSVCDYYVDKGILRYVDDGAGGSAVALAPAPEAPKAAASPAPKPAVASPPQQQAVAPQQAAYVPPSFNRAASSSSINAMENVGIPFVDGTIPCDTPPVQFGADPSQSWYLNGNGWLNSQVGVFTPDGIANLANNKGCVAPPDDSVAVYCQYNCPGILLSSQYSVSRWTRGRSGESVGGLRCKADNRLYRINPNQEFLCMEPSDLVTVEVVNKQSQPIAICKTNYPGDEAMTIPYPVQPGETIQIPVIQSQNFFKADGDKPTTGQFYINEPGVPVEQACIWGTPDQKRGNFVTMNLGAGINGNEPAYAGLFTNYPTQTAGTYPGRITVEGSGISPPQGCQYDGYSGTLTFTGTTKSTVNQGSSIGCTVAVNHGGVLRYIIS